MSCGVLVIGSEFLWLVSLCGRTEEMLTAVGVALREPQQMDTVRLHLGQRQGSVVAAVPSVVQDGPESSSLPPVTSSGDREAHGF